MSFIVIAIYDLGNSYSWFNISFMQHIIMIRRDKSPRHFFEEILMHYIRVGYYTSATTHANGNLRAYETDKKWDKRTVPYNKKNCAEISISAQLLSLFSTQLLTLSQNNYQFFR